MSLRLKDHVALITGASRGIGRASAIALAAEGAKIVGVARTKAELDTLVAQITSTGGAAIAVVADVTKSADVARSVKEAVDAFGSVDILVNNVGMGGYRPFLEWSEEDYDRIMATNAKSSWLYAREIIPVMRKNGAAGGQIINVSSVAGLQAYPNEIIYCMSKAAQQALTQGLDREFFRENIKLLPLCFQLSFHMNAHHFNRKTGAPPFARAVLRLTLPLAMDAARAVQPCKVISRRNGTCGAQPSQSLVNRLFHCRGCC